LNAIEAAFPNLADSGYSVTSPSSKEYNCIAWAADDPVRWWWPDPYGLKYCPARAPRQLTLEAFIAAFAESGYVVCDSAELEAGFEKVAIYLGLDGTPKHAARQLSNGHWSSKLGQSEDIEHHTLEGLSGSAYGVSAQFLKRPIQTGKAKKSRRG